MPEENNPRDVNSEHKMDQEKELENAKHRIYDPS